MDKPEEKYCDKCRKAFSRLFGYSYHQATNAFLKSKEAESFIAKTNFKSLCNQCLAKMEGYVEAAKAWQFSHLGNSLVEGVHYYMEDGNWVFAELYHFLRGYCCKNNCRHCAYGYKKL